MRGGIKLAQTLLIDHASFGSSFGRDCDDATVEAEAASVLVADPWGHQQPVDDKQTVDELLSTRSTPVISKLRVGAYSDAVWDKAFKS